MAPRFAIATPAKPVLHGRWTQRRHARWSYHCASTVLRLVAERMASAVPERTIAFVADHSSGPHGSGPAEAIVISVPALAGRADPASDLSDLHRATSKATSAGGSAVLIADSEAGDPPCITWALPTYTPIERLGLAGRIPIPRLLGRRSACPVCRAVSLRGVVRTLGAAVPDRVDRGGGGRWHRSRRRGLCCLSVQAPHVKRAAVAFGWTSGSLDLDFLVIERRERRCVTRKAARRAEGAALDRRCDGAIDGCGVRGGARACLGPRPGIGSRPAT
jgi:hypothetical protein